MEAITLPAILDSLAQISAFITSATKRAGLDDHSAWQVQLAVDEAATNIIQHGYARPGEGDINLAWHTTSDAFVVTLRDHGRRFNPDDVPAPDITSPLEERQPGGLGIYLMSRLMDSVRFEFDAQQGNLLTMVKHIPPPAAAVHVIELSGRLDAVSTPATVKHIRSAIAEGQRYILLDMAQVTFLSSSGLRALLLARKDLLAHGGTLRLCAIQPQVYEVFVLTGFTQVFAIHQSREEALFFFAQESA